jgi:ligand-binding SRPBCC domain-containing protein
MPHRAQFEQWISAPLESVFRFFATPGNLPRIMPPWMKVRIEEATIVPPPNSSSAEFAGAGSTLLASFRPIPFLPFRIRSEARIVGFAMNDFFADVQDQGPFRSWHHRHEFAAETRNGTLGTRLCDRIEYEIGFEPLGWILNLLFIAPQMRRTFSYRQRAVKRFLVSAA